MMELSTIWKEKLIIKITNKLGRLAWNDSMANVKKVQNCIKIYVLTEKKYHLLNLFVFVFHDELFCVLLRQ